MKIQPLSRFSVGVCLLTVRLSRSFLLPSVAHAPTRSAVAGTFYTTTTTTTRMSATKPGVSSPEELQQFVASAGDALLVIDVRNPDAEQEPGDQKSLAVAGLPTATSRPQAQHLIWDRITDSMPLPDSAKDTPIITHCGGGGRGQKAKDFLMANGFTNVLNGGGPKETDCWKEFGDK